MTYNVRVKPSGIEYTVSENDTLLDAAISSGIYLEHSCLSGSCGLCKARLVSGSVKSEKVADSVLSEEEVSQGCILTCQSKPQSDIEVEAAYYPQLDGIKRSIQPCKVDSLSFPCEDIAILKFRLPPTARFRYVPGQYIQLIIQGERRSYSIANSMAVSDGIELHIRYVEGGLFSEKIFKELKEEQLLRLEGPLGSFFVRASSSPVIFLAGGTGFAPVKAMVEDLLLSETARDIYIYWGMRKLDQLYSDLPKNWLSSGSIKSFVPVFSDEENCKERIGNVHSAVLEDFQDLSGFEVYACGSPEMIEVAKREFLEKGLSESNFYSDAFLASN